MAVGKVRTGPAVEPQTVENAGTDNDLTDPRVLVFDTYARPCIVTNPGGASAAIQIKVNALAANDFDNDSDDDGPGYFDLAAGATVDVSLAGIIAVKRVSFVTRNALDALTDVSVVGWQP